MGLKEALSNDMGKLTDLVGGPKEEIKEEPETGESAAESLEKAFRGESGKKILKSIVEDLKEIEREFKPGELEDVAASQFRQSREFVRRLGSKLPPGVKASMDDDSLVTMTMKTEKGDKIDVYFSPKRGFHFNVNGSTDIGTVKDPDARVQVALAVRSLFRATKESLPEGSVMRTAAHMGDGKGQRRIDIYNSLGFNLPDRNGNMFGTVGPGRKLTPTDQNTWADQARNRESPFFSETQNRV